MVKNGVLLGYFTPNQQDKFYKSERFKHIINYLSRNKHEAKLKEKHNSEGNQLMMRKENIEHIDEVNALLERILNPMLV